VEESEGVMGPMCGERLTRGCYKHRTSGCANNSAFASLMSDEIAIGISLLEN
jgi:hypothetical protein